MEQHHAHDSSFEGVSLSELSSAVTNISAADVYTQVHRKLGFDKLARQLEKMRLGKKPSLTRSTLGGYAQILCGETPRRGIKATTIDKINEEMRGIALDLAIEDRSFARELLRRRRR